MAQEGKIVPYHGVDNIIPGTTQYSEVIKEFGKPSSTKVTPERETSGGVKLGGNTVVEFRNKGIVLLLRKDKINIDSVTVKNPYKGKTPHGMYLGMNKDDVKTIVRKHYFLDLDLGTSLLISKSEGMPSSFQVWFTDGKLSAMKIYYK
jgi:hypothetical protein